MIAKVPIESYRTGRTGSLITRYALWFAGQFIGVRSESAPDAQFSFVAMWPEGFAGLTSDYGLGLETHE